MSTYGHAVQFARDCHNGRSQALGGLPPSHDTSAPRCRAPSQRTQEPVHEGNLDVPLRSDDGLTPTGRRVRRTGAVAGALALGIAMAASACTFGDNAAAPCQSLVLDIAAAPSIAPVVKSVASTYNARHPKTGSYCPRVDVQSVKPAEVANSLSGQGVITKETSPDGWIPDSNLWVDQARSTAAGAAKVSTTSRSVAMSPVVLALPGAVAAKLARSGKPPSWKMLVPTSLPASAVAPSPAQAAAEAFANLPFELKILDPSSNSAGLASLLAMRAVAGHGPRGLANFITAARVAQFITASSDRAVLRAMFSGSKPAGGIMSEQAVWLHNRDHPDEPATAVYPSEGSPLLDFPVVATTKSSAERLALAAFARAMTRPFAIEAIHSQGLRTPDGVAAPGFGPALGLTQQTPAQIPLPNAGVANSVREMWARILIGARMLIVFDVSPSMGKLVPGTNITRLQAMTQINAQGLPLFDASDIIGLWTYDTGLDDPLNYRVVLPMRPLNQHVGAVTQRDLLMGALAKVRPQVDTITALYQTILSAFREVTRGYTPDRFNGVIVDTDGTNLDYRPNALSLRKLLSTLRREFNPQRPVNVLLIGYGHSVDFPAMKRIANATEGAAYEATTPAGVKKFYLQVLTRLVCNASCPMP